MATVTHLSAALQAVLTTSSEAADAALHYTKRPDRATFTASTLVQALVFGWLAHPDATVEQLAQSAARVGAPVSPQAIDQRFSFATAELLRLVLCQSLQHLVAGDPVAIPILQRFSAVRVQDSTTISLPDSLAALARGCGGSTTTGSSAALKCGVQLDLLSGAWHHLDLVDGRASDQRLPLQHAPLPPGSLRLADLGFYDLGVLAALRAAGVYWLSKVEADVVVSDHTHREVALLRFVQDVAELPQWQGEVWLGKGRRLQARLLVQRVPQEVADQRRRRIRKNARDKGHTPSAAALALASWTILITNLPPELLSLPEALVLAKVRWQIELVFKLWKSHGQVDKWRTSNPARVLCEVYAKLLAMVFQHWAIVVGCWGYPDRSLVKAAQVVRDHAISLACACAQPEALSQALEAMMRVLRSSARMNTRCSKPNTYQLLLALTTEARQA